MQSTTVSNEDIRQSTQSIDHLRDNGHNKETVSKKMSYKEKFRSKVRTKLTGIKDKECATSQENTPQALQPQTEAWDEKRDCTDTVDVFSCDNDPLSSSNSIAFLRKVSVMMVIQLSLNTIWIYSSCTNGLFKRIYSDSESLLVISAVVILVVYTTLSYTKKMVSSKRFQVCVWVVLTASIGYLSGGLCFYVTPSHMTSGFIVTICILVGFVTYSKISKDEYLRPVHAMCYGLLCVSLGGMVVQWVYTHTWYAAIIILFAAVSVGGVLLIKLDSIISMHQTDIKMKHHILFSIMIYLDIITFIIIMIRSVSVVNTKWKTNNTLQNETRSSSKFNFPAGTTGETDEGKNL